MSPYQIIGNICVALAGVIFLWPLQKLMSDYADRHLSNDQWVTPILSALIPVWLLLLGALLCVTASGGFDWLRLGRTALYAFAIGSALGLAFVSFALIGLFVRPGFTPSFLYWPPLFAVHLATVLLVVLSLNSGLAPGGSPAWLRWPWTIFAGLGLIGGVIVFTPRILRAGAEVMADVARRILPEGSASPDQLAKIAALDPEQNFDDLLWRANANHSREEREAATARLRSHPRFLEVLAAELERGHVEPAVGFLHAATLTATEQARLARPARQAMQRWVDRIPAPNYTMKDNLKRLRRWGAAMFPVLVQKFAGTGVDFAEVIADFEERF